MVEQEQLDKWGDLPSMFDEKDLLDKWTIVAGEHDGGCYDDSCLYLAVNKETGELCEVESGHCSCYGYEGCWTPVPTNKEVLELSLKDCWRAWQRPVYEAGLKYLEEHPQ